MFTVTMPAAGRRRQHRHVARDGGGDPLLVVSVLVGPASMEVMTAVSGAGAATTRCAAVSWLLELRKNTLTGTRDDGFGWVVVVVGRCGSSRSNGTFDGAMVLGALWVGMAQPAATEGQHATSERPASARRRRRLTPSPSGSSSSAQDRQGEDEAGAARRGGLHADVAVHHAHVLGDERQPQPGARPRAAPARRRAPVEALEHLGALEGIDARAGVVDGDLDLLAVAGRRRRPRSRSRRPRSGRRSP